MYSYPIVLYNHLQCDVCGCNKHTLTSNSSYTLTHAFSRLSYNHITCKINVFEAKNILNKQKQNWGFNMSFLVKFEYAWLAMEFDKPQT